MILILYYSSDNICLCHIFDATVVVIRYSCPQMLPNLVQQGVGMSPGNWINDMGHQAPCHWLIWDICEKLIKLFLELDVTALCDIS